MSLMDPSKQPNTPSKRRRTAKGKAVISEDDLRRSLRLKKVNKGFKTSACKDKNCLGCSVYPPTISPAIIRNLGASFCNINPEDLSNENLQTAPASKQSIVKRAAKAKSSKNAPNKDDNPKD